MASAPEEPPSWRYWKATSGYTYEEMIRGRQSAGAGAYRQQESFLTALVRAAADRLAGERPLELLEFGCGFGRHASYLAGLPGVRYSGYDFSEAMLEPLRRAPPAGVGPEQILCGPSLADCAGGRRFDLVFTVSVLIHNPPERVVALVEQMHAQLRPGGAICLIENQLVPLGVWENGWHDGCWLHAFQALFPRGWELTLHHGAIETHDVYILTRRAGDGETRVTLVEPERAPIAIGPDALIALGMRKLERWAGQASAALRAQGQAGDGRSAELHEQLETTRELLARRDKLAHLADTLAVLRDQRAARPDAPARLEAPLLPHAGVVIDDPLDTHWAAHDPRFGRVVHLFHQQWRGIRAAAGYLPGRKVAITATRPLSHAEARRALEACTEGLTRHLIIHSMSENARMVAQLVRRHAGGAIRVHGVWHGTTAQMHFAPELQAFAELLALRRAGILDAIIAVKPGLAELSPLVHRAVLLNVPPSLAPPPRGAPSGAVLVPLPNDWRKNFVTNVVAADRAAGISTVYGTEDAAPARELGLRGRWVATGPLERAALFRLLARVDLVANATLSECQPMTALEALAHRVPCVTGPLDLGVLDAHPYQRLAQVAAVDSIAAVRAAIERALAVPAAELHALLDDYRAVLERLAYDRLGEILDA